MEFAAGVLVGVRSDEAASGLIFQLYGVFLSLS